MASYFYLDVSLRSMPGVKPLQEIYELRQILDQQIKSLFGEVVATTPIDILKFDPEEGSCILRCSIASGLRVRAALTLCGQSVIFSVRMSYCRKEGNDVIIFATTEDHNTPSTVRLPEPEPATGLILPNGEINWNCPCLGGMATGPCGLEFREAFSCFHNSTAEPKGTECYDAFREMHLCMAEYPELYAKDDDDLKDAKDMEDSANDPINNEVVKKE